MEVDHAKLDSLLAPCRVGRAAIPVDVFNSEDLISETQLV
jgi:hypothetical protein